MHYEVYIDVLFLTNLMMDFLLLLTVRQLLNCHVTLRRVFAGSAVGAVFTCLLLVLPVPKYLVPVLGFAGVSAVMVKIGLAVKGWKQFGKAVALLYISAILGGGILQIFRSYMKLNGIFFILSAGIYFLLCGCWNILLRVHREQRRTCEVLICFGGKEWNVQALMDTGNQLTDSVTREPVHVIDAEIAGEIGFHPEQETTDDKNRPFLRYITYRTVGGTGIMPVFRVEKICIKTQPERWIEKPVLGICGEMLSENEEYQMILNADIL